MPHRNTPMVYLPLGLLYLASALEEKGYKVEIVDGIIPEKEIDREVENFFGIDSEEMKGRIAKKDFDIVGISAQFTFQWENAVKTAQICKEINPDCTVIMGGAHASVMQKDIIKEYEFIDMVVKGEGEQLMPQIVQKVRNLSTLDDLQGIAYKKENRIFVSNAVYIDNLDALPLPAYHLIDMERYFWLMRKYPSRTTYAFKGCERGVSLITSRGCPFNCVFCSIQLHMGREWRAHTPEYILHHIAYLVENYRVNYLHFEDDNLTLAPQRFEKILDGILGSGWKIRWDTPNGIRADTLNGGVLKKCKVTGCTHLNFGIESGSQRVLDEVIEKKANINRLENILSEAKKIGVDAGAFFVIGMPGETKKEIKASIKYALKIMRKYACFGGFSMAVPLLGTRLFRLCLERGYFYSEPSIKILSYAYLIQGIIKTEQFDPDFLKSEVDYFNKRATQLLFFIFLKKIFSDYRLFLYVASNMLRMNPRNWPSIYYKVTLFTNALLFDIENNRGVSGNN